MITRYSDALSASGPTGIAAESFDRSLVAWGRNRKARRKRRRNGSGVLGKVWLIVGLVLGLLIGSVRGARGYDIGGSGDGDDGSNADNVIEDNGRTKPDLDPNSGSGSEDAVVTLGAVASATAMSKASATTTATVTVTVSDADTSSTGTCPKESEGYILKLGDALLSLYGRERQCFTGSEMRQWDRVVSPSSVPSSTALSADTISSSSQAASSDATIDPDSSDSLFDAALFLSFEDWKKRNLEKAGQSPDHIGSSSRKGAGGIGGKKGGRGGSANGAGTGRKRPGNNIHNALDALGDDVEIEWGGFGGTDGGRVEDGRESVSKRVDEGSRDKDGIVDARIVNFAERGGEGSEDTTAQDKAAVAPLTGASTRSSSSREAGKTCKERFNYASFDCGATVLKTNAEGKSPSAVLVEHKDSYMLNECGAKGTKFLIVELCADILVDTVVLANYEFFSSMFRTFRVSVSDRYPPPSSPSITPQRDNGQGTGSNGGDGSSIPEGTNDSEKDTMNSGNKIDKKDIEVGKSKSDGWRELGIFEARNSRDIQAFAIENPLVWARYLRVEFLSHYGSEFYCPVSLLRVHGTTMMEEFRYQQEEAEREHEAENEIVGNEEEDVEGTEDSTEDQVGIDPDKSFVIDVTEQNAVKVHASPKNASPEETSTEGGQSDSHGVISSSDGLASSSIDPYSTSSSIEANSVNNPQQQQSASQDMEKEQLDPIDTLALATTYSNLTMDQLLGMVNEHFKYAGRNYSGASDQQVSDNADEASDIGDAIADAGAESSVKSTPAVIVANTISAKLGTSTSEGLSDATIATENFTETVDIDSKTGTPRNDDNYYTATQATYESGTIVSSSTSIASADAYTHESTISQVSAPDQPESSTSSSYLDLSQSLLTPSTTSIIYASSSSTISQSSISFSTPVSSSSSSSSSLSSSITSYSPSVASTSSSSTRPPSPNPTTQESFFKTVHKRLQMLESNATLSLQYIEDQSRILRDAFLKVERRQSAKIDEHLARLSENITEEIGRYRDQHDQIWQMISLDLSTYRQEHQREIIALSSRLSILADELVFQQRVSIAQSVLLVLCLGLLLFGTTGRNSIAVDSSGSAKLLNGDVATSTSIHNAGAPLLQQILTRLQRALWVRFTGSFQGRSDSAEHMPKKDGIRNNIGSVSTFSNGSSKINAGYCGDSEPEKDAKRESSSDLDTGTYTPASTSVINAPTDHVRELSPSRRTEFRFNEEIFGNGHNNNKGSTLDKGRKQDLQLDTLDGDRREQELLSPPTVSPLLSPSSATFLLDELRETQSGPPTPSGRRSIAQ